MNSRINYVLLRKDLKESPKSISEIAEGCDVDRSVITKLLHQGPAFRGLHLEHFALIVDWLGKSADRYIIRTFAIGGLGEDRSEGDEVANRVSTIGHLVGQLTWYEDRDNAIADWEDANPKPTADTGDST